MPGPYLSDILPTLTPELLIDAARTIEARRAGPEDRLKQVAYGWYRVAMAGQWTTPFQLQAGIAAREAGIIAWDDNERAPLPTPPGWPASPDSALDPWRDLASPVAPFGLGRTPARRFSRAVFRALVGHAYWPGLTAWELMHVLRLGEALTIVVDDWLGEIGRLDERGLELDRHRPGPTDRARLDALEREARRWDTRRERVGLAVSHQLALKGLEVLGYELFSYRSGMFGGQLNEPSGPYFDLGQSAAVAHRELARLSSPAFRRWLDHCQVADRDYATSAASFEARAAMALALVIGAQPPRQEGGLVSALRARRVLADVGWRVCRLGAARGDDGYGARALTRIALAIHAIDFRAESHDRHLGEALAEVHAELGPDDGALVMALGYAPTRDPAAEPEAVRAARVQALIRRSYALEPALGAALAHNPALCRRVVVAVRDHSLPHEVAEVAAQAQRAGELGDMAQSYFSFLAMAADRWQPGSDDEVARRWHYRLATRRMPADPGTHGAYEVMLNPYLERVPLPFDAVWSDELRRTPPPVSPNGGAAHPPFKVKRSYATWYCWVGPGRDGPIYLPLTPRLSALLFALKAPRRLDALVADPDFGLDFVRQAVDEEAVLLFHKPPKAQPERAIDLYDRVGAAAPHDDEPPGPWDEIAMADAYEAFCSRSAHYHESSRALIALAEVPPDARVGELGFGSGVTTRLILDALGEAGRLVAVDPAPLMRRRLALALADPRLTLGLGGARALAWEAHERGPFDRILANASLWLSRDVALALRLLMRAIAPGGRLAFSLPAEHLGSSAHRETPVAHALAETLAAERRRLGLGEPEARSSDPALGSVEAMRRALDEAGWRDARLELFERPWTAGEYLDWLALPVLAESLVAPGDEARAPELVEAVRAAVDPNAPLTAAWYLVSARRQT